MNEERENEELGELPIDHALEMEQNALYPESVNLESGLPINTPQFDFGDSASGKGGNVARRVSEQAAISTDAEVKSVYDSRPINGRDILVTGTVTLSPQTAACPLITDEPAGPYDVDGSGGDGDSFNYNQPLKTGCEVSTVRADKTFGFGAILVSVDETVASITISAYLFQGGTLVDSVENHDLSTGSIDLSPPSDTNTDYVLAVLPQTSTPETGENVNMTIEFESA